jgi:hypothetical protein
MRWGGGGEGIAADNRMADWNSGVFEVTSSTLQDVRFSHNKTSAQTFAMNEKWKHACQSVVENQKKREFGMRIAW